MNPLLGVVGLGTAGFIAIAAFQPERGESCT
jgi:hypothetical protein